MEDLLLDSISEKLLAIDQKTTEIAKISGETNRSIDQIRFQLAALESKEKLTIKEISPSELVDPKVIQAICSITANLNLRPNLLPILITSITLTLLCLILPAGLRVSIPFPHPQNIIPDRQTLPIFPSRIAPPLSSSRQKKVKQVSKYTKKTSHLQDSSVRVQY